MSGVLIIIQLPKAQESTFGHDHGTHKLSGTIVFIFEYATLSSSRYLRVVCKSMSSFARSCMFVVVTTPPYDWSKMNLQCAALSIVISQGPSCCASVFCGLWRLVPRLRYLDIVWDVAAQPSVQSPVLLHGLTHLRVRIACDVCSWHLILCQLSQAIPQSLEDLIIQFNTVYDVADGCVVLHAVPGMLVPHLPCGFQRLSVRMISNDSDAAVQWSSSSTDLGEMLMTSFRGSRFLLLRSDLGVALLWRR